MSDQKTSRPQTTSAEQNTRMAPHSLEAEEATLGSVLIDPEVLCRTLFVSPTDFFVVKHQWIWETILALHEQRDPIDYLTVCEELDRRSQLDEIGGQAYIHHLTMVVPTAIHAEGYARIVEQCSQRRKLLAAASEIAQLAYEENNDVNDAIDKAEQAIFSIRTQRNNGNVKSLPNLIGTYYSALEQRYEHPDLYRGLPTSFIDLDQILGGLKRSDMIVLAGRPSTGKTALLLNIALNTLLKFQQHILIFSLEMSGEQLTERLLAQTSGIDSQRLQSGRLAEDEWPIFVEVAGHLSARNGNGSLWIDDTASIRPMQLRSTARRLHAEHRLDLILIDYLQLMDSDGNRRYENRNVEVAYQTKAIKNLARELNIPVLVVSQLSRAVEQRVDKRPMLSDLRDSGSIEQEADVVLFVHREDLYDPLSTRKNIADVIVAKHRNGPTGSVELYFRKHLTQFVNAARRDVEL